MESFSSTSSSHYVENQKSSSFRSGYLDNVTHQSLCCALLVTLVRQLGEMFGTTLTLLFRERVAAETLLRAPTSSYAIHLGGWQRLGAYPFMKAALGEGLCSWQREGSGRMSEGRGWTHGKGRVGASAKEEAGTTDELTPTAKPTKLLGAALLFDI
ncbi:hypothetical protein AMTR_s00130p00119720 [Amborella trichopoda]|uniref:Uncharacterized protein n=1 Tax=Amborella trichopoda TaxID=13333 RepID=W1NQH9_AMBTC|nr:hypothetical protein AMTR_s00130p00119720 [Amborella trichopoda]